MYISKSRILLRGLAARSFLVLNFLSFGSTSAPWCVVLSLLRSVVIISNRRISNWASQIPKTNMLPLCPYCLKFKIARAWAAKTNMTFWKLTVMVSLAHLLIFSKATDVKRYGQFSKCHVCFCGLDSGNLKFEIVRTNKQHICF